MVGGGAGKVVGAKWFKYKVSVEHFYMWKTIPHIVAILTGRLVHECKHSQGMAVDNY